MKEQETHLTYILLVDKGYYKPRGFYCLNEMQEKFNEKFDEEDYNEVEEGGLNERFEEDLKECRVRLSEERVDKLRIDILRRMRR